MSPTLGTRFVAYLSEHADGWKSLPHRMNGAQRAGAAICLVAIATLVGKGLSYWLSHQSLPLVYLLFVILGAVGFGTRTGLVSAFVAFLAYNFFFIPPIYTFTIADPQEVFALLVFLAVALLTGSLSGRMRDAAEMAQRRAMTLTSLHDFAGRMSALRQTNAILQALATQASQTIASDTVVLQFAGGNFEIVAAAPATPKLNTADWQAAQRCLRSGDVTFASAPTWPGARFEFRPIKVNATTVAVIGLAPIDGRRMVAADSETAMQMLLAHAAIAIERMQLEADGIEARHATERERIRSTLLSSLSHDLKTPLSSILGAASSLREFGSQLPLETQCDLLVAIEEETSRLTHFVANLLDLTRLDTEEPDLKREWIDIADIAQSAVARSKRFHPDATISLAVSTTTQLVLGDAMLMERVVFNLIDNAVKFSTPAAPIKIEVAEHAASVVMTVRDQGRGIEAEQIDRVFDKFYRSRNGDRDIQGTGLGLTICKRVVEGMDGTITVRSPIANGKGTEIVVTLPSSDVRQRNRADAEIRS